MKQTTYSILRLPIAVALSAATILASVLLFSGSLMPSAASAATRSGKIVGRVNFDGTIDFGRGFTVSHPTPNSTYNITVPAADFVGHPAMTITNSGCGGTATNGFAGAEPIILGETTINNQVQWVVVFSTSLGGPITGIDCAFDFIMLQQS